MRATKLVFGLGLLGLASGCIPSLHPLYTEKDLVFGYSGQAERSFRGS